MKTLISVLNNIKGASAHYKGSLTLPSSKTTLDLLRILYKEGLIQKYSLIYSLNSKRPKILINLRYFYNRPVFNSLKVLSRPTVPLHLKYNEICNIYDKRHVLFLCTSKGLLTNLDCKKFGIGGIALFRC